MPGRKASGRPEQQTEAVAGTIAGEVIEPDGRFPVGGELAVSEAGVAAWSASREIDAGIARLQAINTHLCPED